MANLIAGDQRSIPRGTAYHNGALVRLSVHKNGTATGRDIGNAAFMRLREQRTPFGHAARLGTLVDTSTTAVESTTNIPPSEVATGDGAVSVGLHLPNVQCGVFPEGDAQYEVLLYHVTTESAATVQVTPHATAQGHYPVRQHGPRKLWDEAHNAHRWWVAHGTPDRTRYGLTTTPTEQHLWLDEPTNLVISSSSRHRRPTAGW
jgi:hypothetical protein